MRPKHKAVFAAILAVFALNGFASAQTHWVGSWATSQSVAPQSALTAEDLRDTTLRQTVHLSVGGPELRVHVSNRFGKAPLQITSIHIAQPETPGSGTIVTATDRALTFSGKTEVTVPAGADYVSDGISYSVAPLSDISISLHVDAMPVQQTGHPGARTTAFLTHGDSVSAAVIPEAKRVTQWYFISGVDVSAPPQTAAVVVLGDSITDGYGTTSDGNDRWPDIFAKRLQENAETASVAVLNHGIGGNQLLQDGLGVSALARFSHDVLEQRGVRWVVIFEGINDLGLLTRDAEVSKPEHDAKVQRMIGGYEHMIALAHEKGLRVIGGTIMPFVGSGYYHPGKAIEADRQAVNEWIRTPGHFDAVIDFDKTMRDPEHPERLLPAFDCGDHLHPSHAGYAAMAVAVPLSLFAPSTLAASSEAAPQVAFTFDDLPAHASLPPGETRLEVASKIISALRDAHVPPTYGFVNGIGIQNQPADIAVLNAWLASGNKLGNHTWSHINLNQHTVPEFQADIERNEVLLKDVAKTDDWRWLRYPFLAEGDSPQKKAEVRTLLLQKHYKVAAVTMSFADYLYNDAYARCSAKGDTKAVALLENTFMAAADESITYYRRLSNALYGRDIPYVVLMHLGALDAKMMPRLLDLYKSRGFQFVTLQQAERDKFYEQQTDLSLPAGPNNLEGMMWQRNQAPPQHAVPTPNFDTLCR